MTRTEKHISAALLVSTVVVMLNIYAVTSGSADALYEPVNNWLSSLLVNPVQS